MKENSTKNYQSLKLIVPITLIIPMLKQHNVGSKWVKHVVSIKN